jgi:hypothetical protein
MTNAFTAKPKVSAFVADLARNRTKGANATKTAERRNILQTPDLRPFNRPQPRKSK